jgi:glucosamine-6-phosphate deaminase
MRLHVVKDPKELAERAAAIVAATVRRKRSAIIAFPTGHTPLGLYQRLSAMPDLDASRMSVVSIDEYLGVAPDDETSLFGWLRRVAIEPLGIPPDRVLRVPADDPNPARACRAFERHIKRIGGLDLAVLGLGWNGHVAFNEPGSRASSRTRVVALTPGTVARNRRYWKGREPPSHGVTIGIRTLLEARRILLLVAGEEKAAVLHAALRGPITPKVPASLVRQGRLTVIADRAAASLLLLRRRAGS